MGYCLLELALELKTERLATEHVPSNLKLAVTAAAGYPIAQEMFVCVRGVKILVT